MKKTTELQTPCGILRCFDPNKNIIPFEIKPIDKIYKTAVYDEIQSDWVEVAHVCQNICIPAGSLKISENYTCRLCGNYKYSYGDTDENAIANVITSGGFSLSLGAYDPNDNGRSKQMVPVYDGGVKSVLNRPNIMIRLNFMVICYLLCLIGQAFRSKCLITPCRRSFSELPV